MPHQAKALLQKPPTGSAHAVALSLVCKLFDEIADQEFALAGG
jgi:hypothetical protein